MHPSSPSSYLLPQPLPPLHSQLGTMTTIPITTSTRPLITSTTWTASRMIPVQTSATPNNTKMYEQRTTRQFFRMRRCWNHLLIGQGWNSTTPTMLHPKRSCVKMLCSQCAVHHDHHLSLLPTAAAKSYCTQMMPSSYPCAQL